MDNEFPSSMWNGFKWKTYTIQFFSLTLLWLLCCQTSDAAIVPATSPTDFANKTSGRTTNTVNFDTSTVGTLVPASPTAFQELIFGNVANISANLMVSDGTPAVDPRLATISGNNFLGSDSGSFISLNANTSFTLSFSSPVSAVGFYIISESNRLAGEIGIRIGTSPTQVSVVNPALNEITLTGSGKTNSFAYFVGLVDDNQFGILPTVTIFAGPADATAFGIDNILTTVTAVPEPSSIALLLAASTLGCVRLRKILRPKH